MAMSVPGYRHVCRVLDADQYSLRRHGNPPFLQEYLVMALIVAELMWTAVSVRTARAGEAPKQRLHQAEFVQGVPMSRWADGLCAGLNRRLATHRPCR